MSEFVFITGEPEVINDNSLETEYRLPVQYGSVFASMNHKYSRYEITGVLSSLPKNAIAENMVRACVEHAQSVEAPYLFAELPNEQAANTYRRVLSNESVFVGNVTDNTPGSAAWPIKKLFMYHVLIDPSASRHVA